jgi:hypothetical protein
VIHCPDCGRIIYWDDDMKDPVKGIDDISAPPYVTESGDLFCAVCGPRYDEHEDDNDRIYKFDFYGLPEEPAEKLKDD